PSAYGGEVYVLAMSGCTVYAGGYFTSIGGQALNRIAALDAATGAATAWNPNANDGVLALAVSGSTVYAGGYFSDIGGVGQSRISAIAAVPEVLAVEPASGGDDGSVTVTITGINLASCTAVKLARSGQPDIMGRGVSAALSLT